MQSRNAKYDIFANLRCPLVLDKYGGHATLWSHVKDSGNKTQPNVNKGQTPSKDA